MTRREAGFTLVELMIAVGLMLTVTAAVFALLDPAQGAFQVEPERADMQQRVRVAADSLTKDLVMAGGGAYSGTQAGSLVYFFAPVAPYRVGLIGQDPPGTFKPDTITLMYVPSTQAQTSLSSPLPDTSAELKVNSEPGCPLGEDLCGFTDGMTVMIYDANGNFDTFVVTAVQSSAGHLQHNANQFSTAYGIGAKVVEMASHTYYLKSDVTTSTYQLMHYDGSASPDMPVVDHVVGLVFDYYGDPLPPTMKGPLTTSTVPLTTYGPTPPLVGIPPYGVGENCVFLNDGSPIPAPRLADLTAGANSSGLVKLMPGQMTDGPWCPNPTSPNRWDADLLRLRKIGVTLRVEAALEALRGPASDLFTHAGTSRSGMRYAPDQEVRFQVTPRNFNIGR